MNNAKNKNYFNFSLKEIIDRYDIARIAKEVYEESGSDTDWNNIDILLRKYKLDRFKQQKINIYLQSLVDNDAGEYRRIEIHNILRFNLIEALRDQKKFTEHMIERMKNDAASRQRMSHLANDLRPRNQRKFI